jgi:3-hydroxyacyl-CoA dehydrogenase/enoyl-CoA hydratase/3-hydroxybutyryl-CoA epimerase
MDTLTTTLDDHGILTVSIDVPGESMNVLNQALAEDFTQLAERIQQDSAIKAIVLISGKDNSFVAGADIKILTAVKTAEDGKRIAAGGHEVFNRISASSKPFIAAIHGPCLGGGYELALACHYRIATDDRKTKIGLPEVMLGLLPGGRGASLVPRMVSLPNALDLLLTGKQLDAKRAKKMGLVDEVVSPTILADIAAKTALKFAERKLPKRKQSMKDRLLRIPGIRGIILKKAREQVMKTTRGLYPAPLAILDVAETSLGSSLKQTLDVESTEFGKLAVSPEAKQLMNIYFASNDLKKETFIESDATAHAVDHVGILGGGLMGAGIALVSIDKGEASVRMKDIRHEGILSAYKHIDSFYRQRIKRRILSKEQAKKRINQLTGSLNYSGFKQCDLIIEAVFEDLTLKQQMVADIEALGNEDTVFATNTSSIPIGDIAAKAERPANVLGMHYFSPVEKMPLLEIIRHEGTSDQAVATAVAFGKKQGKTVVVVKDGPGFYVNRILAPYINAAMTCGMEGVPFDKIDEALVNFGFPVGPFKLLDEVGIDVGSKVQPILEEAFGERMKGPGLQNQFAASNRLGKKSSKGFYLYDKPKNSKTIDESVYRELNITPNKEMPASKIVERCLLLMLNEAVLCLEDGTIGCPRDGDIAAIFGIGFPPFLGGPFRHMDKRGLSTTVAALHRLQRNNGDQYAPATLLVEKANYEESFYGDE